MNEGSRWNRLDPVESQISTKAKERKRRDKRIRDKMYIPCRLQIKDIDSYVLYVAVYQQVLDILTTLDPKNVDNYLKDVAQEVFLLMFESCNLQRTKTA